MAQDLSHLKDGDLLLTMGWHGDSCSCPHCQEWDRRHPTSLDSATEKG